MNKVRKRGRIAKKAKSKVSNTADDLIDLVSSDEEEKSKRVGLGKAKKSMDFEDSDSDTSMISLIRRDKVMVDCHKQGSMRERILDYLTEETKFSELDWCGYVVEKLRRCKDGWTRCDKGSPFVGPLTVLALLYVDNVECKGMEVDHTVNPITFWNMKKLRVRENLEIRNGGFGMGTFKGLSSRTVNPTKKYTTLLSVDHLKEKIPDVTMKNKKKTENALESIPDEKPRWPVKLTEEVSMADDEFKSVLKGIHVEGGEGSRNEESQDELHDGAEKLYDAATESGGKPTDEAAFPGSNETVTTANFIHELNQFGKGNARGCGGEEEVKVDEAGVVEGRKEGGKTGATEKTTEAGINAANDMMDKVMTQMGDLSGLTLDERLIAMSVIGRSAPLTKMFDGLDVDGKFRMAQMVANGTIR
ncbi:hypothetical protein M8C21_009886 [Ambrosia artemisiifolia]|uniref:Uncharacterized protein n=1 Tax=Ambrosia artemisiifolia TaxID=4212 RepID=A0AAD5DD76_AMBAR|nr:hypothetical protein M8C21_009886 [Ambrosia artemisiifolia]